MGWRSAFGIVLVVVTSGCFVDTKPLGTGDTATDTGLTDTGTDTALDTDVEIDAPIDTAEPFDAGDAGMPDTGTPDTGTPDTGTPDTGTPDTGTPDTGTPDAPDADAPDADACVPMTELCNARDDDCDTRIDEDVALVEHWMDGDGDGFGRAGTMETSCEIPSGRVDNEDDCDDGERAINPDASESCNMRDDDCDTRTDETVTVPHWMDGDGDGFGRAGTMDRSCTVPSGRADNEDDCDDDDGTVFPEATETCNAIDDDCDEAIDEDEDIVVAPVCGCTRRERAGSVYQFCSMNMSWDDADAYCVSRGYQQVEINDDEENDYVTIETGSERTWIGLNDLDMRGDYVWSNGGTSMYRNWAMGEPNRDFERCVELIPGMGEWNDQGCEDPNAFVCELD